MHIAQELCFRPGKIYHWPCFKILGSCPCVATGRKKFTIIHKARTTITFSDSLVSTLKLSYNTYPFLALYNSQRVLLRYSGKTSFVDCEAIISCIPLSVVVQAVITRLTTIVLATKWVNEWISHTETLLPHSTNILST